MGIYATLFSRFDNVKFLFDKKFIVEAIVEANSLI